MVLQAIDRDREHWNEDVDCGAWDVGRGPWAVDRGSWIVDRGPWTWTVDMDCGPKTEEH